MHAKIFVKLLSLLSVLLCLSGCLSTFGIVSTAPASALSSATAELTVPPETTLPAVTLPDHVEVFREGEVSQIPVETVMGTVGDYLIANDPEYFVFTAHETVDMFSHENWSGDMAVYFCISDYAKNDTDEFISDIIRQYGSLYRAIDLEDTTIGGYPATAVYLRDYRENPAYQNHVFLIQCGDENYVLEAQFTAEMYEGLYAIMWALFDTFTSI